MIVSPLGLDDKESGGLGDGVQGKEEMVEKWGVVE